MLIKPVAGFLTTTYSSKDDRFGPKEVWGFFCDCLEQIVIQLVKKSPAVYET
jgi:hypothetical protein